MRLPDQEQKKILQQQTLNYKEYDINITNANKII